MEMVCKVCKWFESTEKAFDIISGLSGPICIVVFDGTYGTLEENVCKTIINEVTMKKTFLPLRRRVDLSAAKKCLSQGQNVITVFEDGKSEFANFVSDLQEAIKDKNGPVGNLVGICYGHRPADEKLTNLDYLITIAKSNSRT